MKFIEKELLILSRRVCRRISRHFGLHYSGVHAVDKRRHDYKSKTEGVLAQVDEDENGRRFIEVCFKPKHHDVLELMDTLCHELAHVATWEEPAMHSKNWSAWYRKIKAWAFKTLI